MELKPLVLKFEEIIVVINCTLLVRKYKNHNQTA